MSDALTSHEITSAVDELLAPHEAASVMLAATLGARASDQAGSARGPRDQGDIVFCDPVMRGLYENAARAARGRLPVLLLGETGVGKEHLAQAIHRASSRRDRPLVAVNCGAIAPSLLESALFGHERGAFTGATQRSAGMFEHAHGGTLLLDEVGDLPANAQVALLRAIELQKVTRLGSTLEIPVDVLVIAATHCDLESMVEAGSFRQDLFFRLNGVRFDVPPLRERPDEIEPLARSFLARACREWNLGSRELSPEALAALRRCRWPGNVRQLRYAIERAALLASATMITPADLPDHVTTNVGHRDLAPTPAAFNADIGLKSMLKRYERMLLEEAVRRAGGDRRAAAKLLRVPMRTLFRKLRANAADQD